MSRVVAVTGATGFLGRHLVRALGAAGFRVRALVRQEAGDLPAEVVRGSLSDAGALSALCEGTDVVIHGAGLVKARNRAAFEAVNVEGARRVAEAARKVPHVVLVSSLAARAPHLSAYAASKQAGEAAMAQVLGERLTIARPTAIYGPGDRELLPLFRAAAASPVLPLLDPARITVIHVDDAARQIAALAAAPCGGIVALSDARPEGYSWRELMSTAATACGRSPRFVAAPRFAVRGLALANDLAAFLGAAPMLTSGKARELLHPDWAISPKERSDQLPEPNWELAAGFTDTVAWCLRAGWMTR